MTLNAEREVDRRALADTLRHWLVTMTAVLLFATVLYYSYKLKVSPLFAYQGLTFRDPELVAYGVALGAAVLVALALPRRIRHASDFVLWVLYVLVGAPSILLPQYMDTLTVSESTRLGLVVASCMVLARMGASMHPRLGRLRPAPELSQLAWPAMAIFTVANYAYLILTVGLPTGWVSVNGGYDVRADFAVATGGTLIGYLLPVQYNVINPIFIARGFYARQRWVLAAGISGQVLIYLLQPQKSVLFSGVALFGLAWMFRKDPHIRGASLLRGAIGLAFTTLAIDAVLHSFTWTSLFVRRFLIVPGALTVAYVSVFGHRPKTNFSGTLLPWMSSPYDGQTAPTYIVGALFSGDPTTNANVNIFGDGYLNYGYLGMAAVTLILVGLLWVADAVTEGLPMPVVAMIWFMPTVALSSASLFTAMLTHGLVGALVLCAWLPRDGWDQRWTSASHPELARLN